MFKKIALSFCALGLFLAGDASAQTSILPSGAVPTFEIYNKTRGDVMATTSGAKPGEILEFRLKIDSPTTDLNEFQASYDISDIIKAMDLVGEGTEDYTVTGSTIYFAPFSQKAPCEKIFTFTARVKEDCGSANNILVSPMQIPKQVELSCAAAGGGQPQPEVQKPVLNESGASNSWLLLVAGSFALLIAGVGVIRRA